MPKKLPPCPHCGPLGDVYIQRLGNRACWLLCAVCRATGPISKTQKSAIAAWPFTDAKEAEIARLRKLINDVKKTLEG